MKNIHDGANPVKMHAATPSTTEPENIIFFIPRLSAIIPHTGPIKADITVIIDIASE